MIGPVDLSMHPRISRRAALQVGVSGLGAVGAFWNGWLQAAVAGAGDEKRRAKSVILIFNCGAPSHLDLFDPKPDAPEEVRGPFNPIATTVPGVRISELLPHGFGPANLKDAG